MEVIQHRGASIVSSADGTETADAVRAQLHRMWSSVAPGWDEHAAFVDARAGAITERLPELARLEPGDRVLELACGAGGLGLAAAARVGARGEVVLSDVAPEMTAIARRRADSLGVDVRTCVLDLEAIDEPEASYDAVLCREGLMLVPDPARAVREIARVLRPGGRVALAVWGPRERNPWLGVVFDAAGAELGAPVPPPGLPGPFSLDDADRFSHLLAGAGLVDVRVAEEPAPYRATSAVEWWSRTVALSGPLGQRLAALPGRWRAPSSSVRGRRSPSTRLPRDSTSPASRSSRRRCGRSRPRGTRGSPFEPWVGPVYTGPTRRVGLV